jgi:hypothetical protein
VRPKHDTTIMCREKVKLRLFVPFERDLASALFARAAHPRLNEAVLNATVDKLHLQALRVVLQSEEGHWQLPRRGTLCLDYVTFRVHEPMRGLDFEHLLDDFVLLDSDVRGAVEGWGSRVGNGALEVERGAGGRG